MADVFIGDAEMHARTVTMREASGLPHVLADVVTDYVMDWRARDYAIAPIFRRMNDGANGLFFDYDQNGNMDSHRHVRLLSMRIVPRMDITRRIVVSYITPRGYISTSVTKADFWAFICGERNMNIEALVAQNVWKPAGDARAAKIMAGVRADLRQLITRWLVWELAASRARSHF